MMKIERGMLLLAPADRGMRAVIWAVTSESRKTIVSHSGEIKVEATLSHDQIPEDWTVIDNHKLAEHLIENGVPA
jgi:hypothetical protein